MSRAAQGSGSIRKKTVTRGGKQYTFWEGRVTIGRDPGTGKQIQKSFSGKTQKEVLQKMQTAAVQVMGETYHEPAKITVREWLETWEREYLGDVKPFTIVSYHGQIHNHIIPALGAVKLKSLTTPEIQRFYNALDKKGAYMPLNKRDKSDSAAREYRPVSPKTIKNIHGVLHRALQQAVSIGYIPFNPSDACTLPRVQKKEISPLDEEQIGLFLAAIENNKYETLFTVTLFTGMREGEVLGLCWDRVNFKDGTITIDKQLQHEKRAGGRYVLAPLKNDKPRIIQPAPFVMELLRKHKIEQFKAAGKANPYWNNTGFVFTDELGENLKSETVYKNFKKVVERIGLPDIRFHDLRHSYAVASIRAGDDIKTVQSNLGHATAAFTLDVYGHVTDQMKKASSERMEGFIKAVLSL